MVEPATTQGYSAPPRAVAALAQNAFYKIVRSLDRHPPAEAAIANSSSHNRVAKAIQDKIHDNNWLGEIRKHYAAHGPSSRVDYSNPLLFSSFDTLYFFKNLFKACSISAYLQTKFSTRQLTNIVDLGCGSGAFGLSWYQIHRDLDADETSTPPHIAFVDNQDWQLHIAGALAQSLEVKQFHLINDDVFETNFPVEYLRISSYLFCGQSDRLKLIDSGQFERIFGAAAAIVDYENTLAALQSQAEIYGYRTLWIRLRSTVPPQFLELTRSFKIEARALVIIKNIAAI